MTGLPEYIGREVAPLTAADIILIFIGIIGLLIAFGSFVIALLAFLDRDKDYKRKKQCPPCCNQNGRLSLRGKIHLGKLHLWSGAPMGHLLAAGVLLYV